MVFPRLHQPPARASNDWRPGDLLVFWGRGWTSRVIEAATRGPSHVGIIAPRSPVGDLLLFESTTLCDLPCEINHVPHCGVQAHKPTDRLANYDGGISLMRLTPAWELQTAEVDRLTGLLRGLVGLGYDTPGALISGTKCLRLSRLMPYPDLGSLFCSELCAHVLMRVGRLPLDNASGYSPATLVRRLRRCGTYSAPTALID